MSRFRTRRAFAGWVLAALLATAPARAAGVPELVLPLQDLWSRAWSWLTDLWTANSEDAARPGTLEKDQLPGLPPGPPPYHPGDPPAPPPGSHGEQGPGIDPDG